MQQRAYLSEHQRRIVLLSHLGWRPGQPITTYAQAVTNFWFGTHGGVPIVGVGPMNVPSKKIAEFIVHYAPSNMVKREVAQEVQREYRVE